MNAPVRILVLHDSLAFGGHERAFLTWLPGLLASPDVARLTLAHPAGNLALAEALRPFAGPKLEVRLGRFFKRRAEPFLAPLRLNYRAWVRDLVEEERPDIVLLLQGRIENLAVPALVIPRGPEVVSYLPMAHSGREMRRPPLLAELADAAKRPYYRRPDRFIVPSEAVSDQLRRAGARGSVHVVRNVPDARAAPVRGPRAPDRKVALYLGRIEARQKGLDLLVRSLEHDRTALDGYEFRFCGGGPDLAWLHQRLRSLPEVLSQVQPWTDDPGAALAEADLVLTPSRWEGVPLVLLEALASRTPVLASSIDVFREHLPADNRFAFGGPGLARALDACTSPLGRQQFAAHARSLDRLMDLAGSRADFVAAVLGRPVAESQSLKGAA